MARQTGTAAGGPLKRLTLELGGKPESAGRRIRTCMRAGQPGAEDPQRHADCPFAPEHSLRRTIVYEAAGQRDAGSRAVAPGKPVATSVVIPR